MVKLGHAAEGVVAYPRQPVAADQSDRERERGRKRSGGSISQQEGAAQAE